MVLYAVRPEPGLDAFNRKNKKLTITGKLWKLPHGLSETGRVISSDVMLRLKVHKRPKLMTSLNCFDRNSWGANGAKVVRRCTDVRRFR